MIDNRSLWLICYESPNLVVKLTDSHRFCVSTDVTGRRYNFNYYVTSDAQLLFFPAEGSVRVPVTRWF